MTSGADPSMRTTRSPSARLPSVRPPVTASYTRKYPKYTKPANAAAAPAPHASPCAVLARDTRPPAATSATNTSASATVLSMSCAAMRLPTPAVL